MRALFFVLLFLLSTTSCLPAAPKKPAAAPAADADGVPDAPWRGELSQAAGHELRDKAPTVLLRGARLLIGDGSELKSGHVLLAGGKIRSVGEGDGVAPEGARIIDVKGKTITPGLIDTHSHLGVYPSPGVAAHRDGNEMTTPVTPGVRAVDAVWVQDPGFQRAIAGGVTTIQVLPGSGNLIGGRAVTLKLRPATTARAMHFLGAPDGLKMACGENPKRVYGERKQKPMTRMGNLAMQRSAFMKARRLIREWDVWRQSETTRRRKSNKASARAAKQKERDDKRAACKRSEHAQSLCRSWKREWKKDPIGDPYPPEPKLPPARDVDMETLAAALEGQILVHVHCYRSDDMANMLALSDEAGFKIRSFHHALEAYKIRQDLARREVSVSTWADWWGFKMEAYDGIPHNLAMVESAGGRAIVHSDSSEGIQRLNQEAAKGMYAGRHVGMRISEARAIQWITLNPAWALGVHERVGSLTVGKDADVVVWDNNPFSVYARAELVFVDGVKRHDANTPGQPWSDFEAGQ